MPKEIQISPAHRQVFVDGKPFPFLITDKSLRVEKIHNNIYEVTVTLLAEEVNYYVTPLAVGKDGQALDYPGQIKFFGVEPDKFIDDESYWTVDDTDTRASS